MQGNILITVLILLTVLSLSALYSARESLWAMKTSQTERDRLQLELLVDEVLLEVEHLVKNLPAELTILPVHEANFFLEQSLASWLVEDVSLELTLSNSIVQAWVIFEDLNKQQYFRTTILLLTDPLQSQLRMQATWNRATLKGDIIEVKALTWR